MRAVPWAVWKAYTTAATKAAKMVACSVALRAFQWAEMMVSLLAVHLAV